MFNLAIDSKLRGCDVVAMKVEDVAPSGYPLARATVRQRKTGRPARFELTEQTRQAVDDYLILSDGEHIIDLDSEIRCDGRSRPPSCGGAAERVRGKDVRVQSDARDQFCDEPRVLPGCHGLTNPPAAGEQKFAWHLAGRLSRSLKYPGRADIALPDC